MRQQHYLGFRKMCGRQLRHVAVHGERWLALLGWQSPALRCAARERWIGWSSLQRRMRLFLVVNNTRFLVLAEAERQPGLASRVLSRSLRRLPGDWLARYKYSPLLCETFVDPARFRGTCYRAANWIEVGATTGYARVRGPKFYAAHHAPKSVFVYPLRPDARQQLRAARPDPSWRPWMPAITLTPAQLQSLHAALRSIPDQRSRQGQRYPTPTVLTIVLAARFAGSTSLTDIASFAKGLSQQLLARIGSRRRPQTNRYHTPCASTLHYLLQKIDIAAAERILGQWARDQLDEVPAVALDGKTLRGSYNHDLAADGKARDEPAQQQLSTVDLGSRVVIGQLGFSGEKDEAEGAALRQQLSQLDAGTIVIADALHTSRQTGQAIVDHDLHYLLTVKGNQPTLLETLEEYAWHDQPVQTIDLDHGRIETRTLRRTQEIDRDVPQPWLDFPDARFAARLTTRTEFKKDGRERQPETRYLITNLPEQLAAPERLLELARNYWGAIETAASYYSPADDLLFQPARHPPPSGLPPGGATPAPRPV